MPASSAENRPRTSHLAGQPSRIGAFLKCHGRRRRATAVPTEVISSERATNISCREINRHIPSCPLPGLREASRQSLGMPVAARRPRRRIASAALRQQEQWHRHHPLEASANIQHRLNSIEARVVTKMMCARYIDMCSGSRLSAVSVHRRSRAHISSFICGGISGIPVPPV